MGFVCAIGICYAMELGFIHPDWKSAAFHTLVPMIDHSSIYLAVSMLGATVMPHMVYLHSALVQPRLRQQLTGVRVEEVAPLRRETAFLREDRRARRDERRVAGQFGHGGGSCLRRS